MGILQSDVRLRGSNPRPLGSQASAVPNVLVGDLLVYNTLHDLGYNGEQGHRPVVGSSGETSFSGEK